MNPRLKRSILRWIHIICGIPMIGYIYGEPAQVQQYAGAVRFVFFPIIVLSGFWMWKGDALRQLIWKKQSGPAQP